VSSRAWGLAAFAVGLAILVVGLGVALLDSEPRLAGTNNVRDPVFAAVVPGGATVCQAGEGIPAGTDRLRVLVGTYGAQMPPLKLVAAAPGFKLSGSTPGGGPQGYASIPVPRTEHATEGLVVCLRNGGSRRIAIGGEAIQPVASIGRRPADGRVRLAWYRPGNENWFQLAGTVLHRFGYGNAPWFGGWLLVLAALVLLGAGALAVAAVLRTPEPEDPGEAAAPPRPEIEGGW
jgi:hypothetical protein